MSEKCSNCGCDGKCKAFPVRQPANEEKALAIVQRIVKGSNDANEFGGIVYAIKKDSGATFLVVLHSADASGSKFSKIRAAKNTINSVLDTVDLLVPTVEVDEKRY